MPTDEKHVGQRVAARILEVDHHDVGIVGLDGGNEPHVAERRMSC